MKNFIRFSNLKMEKAAMQQVSGGAGNGQGKCKCNQNNPPVVLRYAIYPLYGIIIPDPQLKYGITAP